jgi:deoxyribonuclease-2
MAVEALDEQGNPIDWWFIYKVPKLTKSANTDSATGYEYVYFDARSKVVNRSPFTLDQDRGALHETLDSVFTKPKSTVGWVLYNDEKPALAPGSDDGNLGHTKGVIAFDTASGTAFWLLHSWPKYAAPGLVGMPTPMFGQTFLCISLDIETANSIAEQMRGHQEPQVYLPRTANLQANDALFILTGAPAQNPPPDASVLECKSKGGMPFRVLAKNREWNQDFWNGFVGPQLQADMDVETWIRGPIPPVADTDGIHKTFDIKYINLGPLGVHFAWPETHDHAKWGITKAEPWICVGDMNRMISQRQRGGGTIAFQNQVLWTALGKTDLILAPPGHTRDEALALIRSTHVDAEAAAAAAAVPKARGRGAGGVVAKKKAAAVRRGVAKGK